MSEEKREAVALVAARQRVHAAKAQLASWKSMLETVKQNIEKSEREAEEAEQCLRETEGELWGELKSKETKRMWREAMANMKVTPSSSVVDMLDLPEVVLTQVAAYLPRLAERCLRVH